MSSENDVKVKYDFEFQQPPEFGEIVATEIRKEDSNGNISENMLTKEELKQVNAVKEKIDITDSNQVISYGAGAQQGISAFSSSCLKNVNSQDLGEIGDSLKELTIALNATTKPKRKGIIGLFNKAQFTIETLMANYSKADENVKKIEKDLQMHQKVLSQDIKIYDQMYELNLKYYKELTMYVLAGRKALEDAQNGKLSELKEIAKKSNSNVDAERYKDYEDHCNRFDKRLHDLELTRVISIQLAPQIRMLQNNDESMLEKIQSSIINTIPLWRNQMVLALGIEHGRRAIDAQKAVSDMTNKLLRDNAEKLKQGAIDAATENERSIVDIDTLKNVNEQLIMSLNEVMRIHEEGSHKRAEAQHEIAVIEGELKQALLEAANKQKGIEND